MDDYVLLLLRVHLCNVLFHALLLSASARRLHICLRHSFYVLRTNCARASLSAAAFSNSLWKVNEIRGRPPRGGLESFRLCRVACLFNNVILLLLPPTVPSAMYLYNNNYVLLFVSSPLPRPRSTGSPEASCWCRGGRPRGSGAPPTSAPSSGGSSLPSWTFSPR